MIEFPAIHKAQRGCKLYPAGVVVELSDPCVVRSPSGAAPKWTWKINK